MQCIVEKLLIQIIEKNIYVDLVLTIMYEEEKNKFLNLNLIIAGISQQHVI